MLLFLLMLSQTLMAEVWQDGVIVHKTAGGGYMYIFPAGKDSATGKITIGSTIVVEYSLEILSNKRARFIGLDAAKTQSVNPKLSVGKSDKLFGFRVKDARVPTLQIFIEPTFMSKVRQESAKSMEEKMARHGNLNVILEYRGNGIVIERVVLD